MALPPPPPPLPLNHCYQCGAYCPQHPSSDGNCVCHAHAEKIGAPCPPFVLADENNKTIEVTHNNETCWSCVQKCETPYSPPSFDATCVCGTGKFKVKKPCLMMGEGSECWGCSDEEPFRPQDITTATTTTTSATTTTTSPACRRRSCQHRRRR